MPLVLAAWGRLTTALVALPAIHSAPAGLVLVLAALCLALARPYAWVRSPVHIAFGLACAGVSIGTGSASGLWLVTPVACLGAAALRYGLERPDALDRLHGGVSHPPRLSFPRGDRERPDVAHRAAVFAWVLIPWTLTWFGTQALGRPPDAFSTAMPFEDHWPVWQWTESIYLSTYLFIPVTALLLRTQGALRRFAVSGGVSTAIVSLCWLTIPVVAYNRAFEPTNAWGRYLALEQGHSIGVAAFPAFHVLWSLIAADAWSLDGRLLRTRWRGIAGWTWGILIAVSCLTTGMHTVIDAVAASLLFPLVRDPAVTRERIRRATERLANSWRGGLVGPARVVTHGLYAAGVLAGFLGAMTAPVHGARIVPLLAACAIAMPWIQAIGRLPVRTSPLLAIAGHVVIGIALLRLRQLHAPDVMVIGLYLLLTGLSRFAEEGYGADPQTPVVAGLRASQWIAVASIAVGMWWTTLTPGLMT